MRKLLLYSLPIGLLLLGASCRTTRPGEPSEKLAEKAEPYDLFSFQRSYPDRDFDWKGWRKTLVQSRIDENINERSPDCTASTIDWTIQGAGNVAGRVNAMALHPTDQNTLLAGFSGGGIFKTTDGGVNWYPVFDSQPELSIGDITYDPIDPDIVYAGTGDPNMPSIVFNGNGVYKSSDGGETWSYLALSQQGIVSKVVIDHVNNNILYAACMGNPYIRDEHRGVYKSSDGGTNWEKVLFVSNQAGASDLVIDPVNPQILYASFWDRIRNNQESVIYGEHARVYKTTDGGATWTQLGGGLPTGIMGRTGLAISQQNPNKLYAVYVDTLSKPGGLFKTTDGGETWSSININSLNSAYSDFGWYFGKVRVNSNDDEDIYFLAILLWRRLANGSWQVGAGAHADCHDMAFASSGRRYLATDGGVYRNDPNQMSWTKSKNLPTTQFYHTDYNPHQPDIFYGGAQDNGIQKGNGNNINNWLSVFSADGFRCAFHPTNPNMYWVETQNGSIHRTTDNGDTWITGQPCMGTVDRCNWDTPYFLSIHGSNKLYAGGSRVFVSADGSGWGSISPDLTDGVIFAERFHTISCLTESPLMDGKLMAGTSDGNVWWREPDGDWFNVTDGLPNRYVTSVVCSPTNANRMFVTHSGFRDNEHIPHVHRSDDNGQTWVDISDDLPQLPVNDLLVLPGHADSVLFAATDGGVFFTRNSGNTWARLGKNMPIIPVFDLERNPSQGLLVAATFARGIWTIPIDSVFTQQSAKVDIAGNIKTETNTPIAYVLVGNDTTLAAGSYLLKDQAGCKPLTVKPSRLDNPLNGVTTFDLVKMSQHILTLNPLDSPYKLIAADVNRSGSVTTFDIVTLRRLILGIDTVFNNNTSWRFIDAGFNFTDPANPFGEVFPEAIDLQLGNTDISDINFIGIKTGDVNGSADPGQLIDPDDRNLDKWPLRTPDYTLKAGETVVVDISGDWPDMAGVQFTLQFDPEKLSFQRVEPILPGIGIDHFGLNRVDKGLLAVCIDQARPAAAQSGEQVLFRLVCTARASGRLSDALAITEYPTRALAYRENGEVFKPVLEFGDGTSDNAWQSGAQPNPFGSGGVWLRTGADTDVRVQIMDVRGAILLEKNIPASEARFPVHIPARIFPQNGAYFYNIHGSNTNISGKIVFEGK